MRNLKLTLAYDGSDFHGWQIQPDHITVQAALAAALLKITGETVLPQGSGRTDAGVHALAQVATFELASPIPTLGLRIALNDSLPPSIRVLEVKEVPTGFHARANARAKTYRYRIYRGDICPPFLARYVYHHPWPLDEGAMIGAAGEVVGEHDFTSFAAVDPDRAQRIAQAEARAASERRLCGAASAEHETEDAPTNIRTIYSSQFERVGDELVYTVRGSGFLHHMVRNLVGTFLLVGKGSLTPGDIRRILIARNRSAAGATAPASGLYLVSVDY
jgi:tRNA pseudouridine38-40 synthase